MKIQNVIGCDETGVGDYLTPLVAAAVYIPEANIGLLKSLGVQDSKNLNDRQILEIFERIKMKIKSNVRSFSQAQYNFLNQKYNAHELKWILHTRCINALYPRIDKVEYIVVDKFATQKNIDKYNDNILKDKDLGLTKVDNKILLLEEKGEQFHTAVAAASIVARAHLISLMKLQNEKWKMNFPLGTNSRVEDFAKQFVKNHGKSNLYKVAKYHFKTTQNVLE